jgi:Tfp pilus assembly protein PilF
VARTGAIVTRQSTIEILLAPRALQDLQRNDQAIEVAQQIAEIDPDEVLAHTSLSVLYQKKGMIAEAEDEGAKARVLGWKQQLKGGM